MATETTTTRFTVILMNTEASGDTYRVTEIFNSRWEPRNVPLYTVERSRGAFDPRFFTIYIGEDRARAMSLAGAH